MSMSKQQDQRSEGATAHETKLQSFRVIGAHPNRNLFEIEVQALNGLSAFGQAALVLKEADEDGEAEFYAAVPSGTPIELPGEGVVTLSTVLDPEQADVFGLQQASPGADGWSADTPIRRDAVFADAPGFAGAAWHNLAAAENAMAELLVTHPPGTVAVNGNTTWFLREDAGKLILYTGTLGKGVVEGSCSRFGFGLDWVDVEIQELEAAVERLNRAVEEPSMVWIDPQTLADSLE